MKHVAHVQVPSCSVSGAYEKIIHRETNYRTGKHFIVKEFPRFFFSFKSFGINYVVAIDFLSPWNVYTRYGYPRAIYDKSQI